MNTMYDFRELNERADIKTLYETITGMSLRKHSDSYEGACPMCGGTDRFYIKYQRTPQQWTCRHCQDGKMHTALDFVKTVCHMDSDPLPAVAEKLAGLLNLSPSDCAKYNAQNKVAHPKQERKQQFNILPDEPSDEWQRSVTSAVNFAHDYLMSKAGINEREYLLNRGFTVETLKQYRIGFNKDKYLINATDKDGNFITASTGYYIPTFVQLLDDCPDEALMKVKVRIEPWLENILKSQGKKYQKYWYITGGEPKSLFCAEYCRDPETNDRIIYVEGEMDAMTINQVAGDICKAVTFGSNGNVRDTAEQWHPWFSAPVNTVICFDNDSDPVIRETVRKNEEHLQAEIIKAQSLDEPEYRADAPIIRHLPEQHHDWNDILQLPNGAQIIREYLTDFFRR